MNVCAIFYQKKISWNLGNYPKLNLWNRCTQKTNSGIWTLYSLFPTIPVCIINLVFILFLLIFHDCFSYNVYDYIFFLLNLDQP